MKPAARGSFVLTQSRRQDGGYITLRWPIAALGRRHLASRRQPDTLGPPTLRMT